MRKEEARSVLFGLQSWHRWRVLWTVIWRKLFSPPVTQSSTYKEKVARMRLYWGHRTSPMASGICKRRRSSATKNAFCMCTGPPSRALQCNNAWEIVEEAAKWPYLDTSSTKWGRIFHIMLKAAPGAKPRDARFSTGENKRPVRPPGLTPGAI